MIYLDHAAATPLSKRAANAMSVYFDEKFFNPSAAYLPAQRTRHEYEDAKDTIAHAIGAKGADLVMTSGATESINLAFSIVTPGAKFLFLMSSTRRFVPAPQKAEILTLLQSTNMVVSKFQILKPN